jgi:hypothetical protein
MRSFQITSSAIITLLFTSLTTSLNSQTSLIMAKQLGSAKDEYSMNHLIDKKGNIYIAGKTTGIMNGSNRGGNDGFLTKIDSLGNTLWTKQFGTEGEEDVLWSAIDNIGSVYVTGSTTGVLADRKFGKEDIFIIKFNTEGESEWVRQFGTDSAEVARGVYADSKGFIYLTGMTGGKLGQKNSGKTDCFIMKLDQKGNQLITFQFGTPGDDCGYSITGGFVSDIFVCGTTWGEIKGKNYGFIDGFTGQFTDKLEPVGFNQFGTNGFDIAMILSVDGQKNIYIGGTTSGNFGGQQRGEGDAFILKMSEKGEILWNNQFGTDKNDGVRGIALSPGATDNIIISGVKNLPPAEAFVRIYSNGGELLGETKFAAKGKNGDTSGKDVNVDSKGNIYHLGLTGANLFGSSYGEHDFYIVKFRFEKTE